MDWMQIFSAFALVIFIVILFPRTREMLNHSTKATTVDWLSFAIPIVVVFLFIVLLIKLV